MGVLFEWACRLWPCHNQKNCSRRWAAQCYPPAASCLLAERNTLQSLPADRCIPPSRWQAGTHLAHQLTHTATCCTGRLSRNQRRGMRVVSGANRIARRRGLGSGDDLMDEETIRAGQGRGGGRQQPKSPPWPPAEGCTLSFILEPANQRLGLDLAVGSIPDVRFTVRRRGLAIRLTKSRRPLLAVVGRCSSCATANSPGPGTFRGGQASSQLHRASILWKLDNDLSGSLQDGTAHLLY